MGSAFSWIEQLGPSGFLVNAIFVSLASIGVLLAYILVRRAYRRRQIRTRAEHTIAIRNLWDALLDGRVPVEHWRFNALDCDIIETILLDQLEVAPRARAKHMRRFLRTSGLLDRRIYESRHVRGWQRQRALAALGRMRTPEGIPALTEALDDPSAETRVAAIQALGRTGVSKAAVPILDRITRGSLHAPATVLQNTLFSCCRLRPSVLLSYVPKAEDTFRPMLARVLAEVATPELGDDLQVLVSDPLAEVRASAARALGQARPQQALMLLANLAADEEWFVRLRAAVALGELRDVRAIPALIETLCDSNRYVRLRSAAALARLEAYVEEILGLVQQRGDLYALHALVSELERSGCILRLLDALADPKQRSTAESVLLAALQAGTHRLLLDALAHHANGHVRVAVARLLAHSGNTQLLPQLETLNTAAKTPRQQRIIGWLVHPLRSQLRSGPLLPEYDTVHA